MVAKESVFIPKVKAMQSIQAVLGKFLLLFIC